MTRLDVAVIGLTLIVQTVWLMILTGLMLQFRHHRHQLNAEAHASATEGRR